MDKMFVDLGINDIFIHIIPYVDSKSLVHWSQTGSCIYWILHSLLPHHSLMYLESHDYSPDIRDHMMSLIANPDKRFFHYFVMGELAMVSYQSKFQDSLYQIYIQARNLKHLNLYGFLIGNDGLKRILNALTIMKVNLECLNLGNNDLNSEGMAFLCAYLPNHFQRLQILSLNNNQIDQNGIHELTQCLLENPPFTITAISISDNPLNDKAAQILSDFLDHPLSSSLTFLCLCRTDMTCVGKISVLKSWGLRKPIGLFI